MKSDIIWVLVASFLAESSRGIVLSSLTPCVYYLHGSPTTIGIAIALYSLGRLLSAVPLGYLQDRLNSTSRTLQYASAGGALLNLFYGLLFLLPAESQQSSAAAIVLLCALRFGIGFFSGTLAVVRSYLIKVSSDGQQRTQYITWSGLVQYIGFSLTPLIPILWSLFSSQSSSDTANPGQNDESFNNQLPGNDSYSGQDFVTQQSFSQVQLNCAMPGYLMFVLNALLVVIVNYGMPRYDTPNQSDSKVDDNTTQTTRTGELDMPPKKGYVKQKQSQLKSSPRESTPLLDQQQQIMAFRDELSDVETLDEDGAHSRVSQYSRYQRYSGDSIRLMPSKENMQSLSSPQQAALQPPQLPSALPQSGKEPSFQSTKDQQKERMMQFVKLSVAVYFFLNFALRGIIGVAETIQPTEFERVSKIKDQSRLITMSSAFFASLGMVGLVVFILIPIVQKRLNRVLARRTAPEKSLCKAAIMQTHTLMNLFGIVTLLVGSILVSDYIHRFMMAPYAAGMVLIWSVGSPLCQTVVIVAFSEALNAVDSRWPGFRSDSKIGTWMGSLTTAGSVGRIVLPTVASMIPFDIANGINVLLCLCCILALITQRIISIKWLDQSIHT
ncbi:hypothetical protein MP228_012050 [Amoeboaphelidium protococcarum]|nr:hypothetical protein MP228_012050 [Amoeboaphelidium protococcarum]